MDIDSVNGDDGSETFTVKLTALDIDAHPNAMALINAAGTCAEMLMGLAVAALEMQAKGGEFQMALREATARKSSELDADCHHHEPSPPQEADGERRARPYGSRRSGEDRRQQNDALALRLAPELRIGCERRNAAQSGRRGTPNA